MAPRKETALVPIQTAAMLERKTTPELSFTNGRRAGHPADPSQAPSDKGVDRQTRTDIFCVELSSAGPRC